MANISVYLQKILDATYGEEVRGSIHDSIEEINKESTQAKNDASSAKNSAQASATAASQSASSASESAAAALASKTSAANSESEATKAKTDALQAKNDAKSSEGKAAQSESNALSAKERCEDILAEIQGVNAEIEDKVEAVVSLKQNLISGHKIEDVLIDSSNEAILDSGGQKIFSKTIFADAYDIIKLQNKIDSLEQIVKFIFDLAINARLINLEEHSLLDAEY